MVIISSVHRFSHALGLGTDTFASRTGRFSNKGLQLSADGTVNNAIAYTGPRGREIGPLHDMCSVNDWHTAQ